MAAPHLRYWPGGLWLVGCHGGAGVSTLLAVGLGTDAGRSLPHPAPPAIPAGLLLVTRASAVGLHAASAAAEFWQAGHYPPGLTLEGLIVVAAGPGRPPRIVRERLDLVAGWFPHVWQIRWLPELLGIDAADVATSTTLRAALPRDLIDTLAGRTP